MTQYLDRLGAALRVEAPNSGSYGYGFQIHFEELRRLPDGKIGVWYRHPQYDGLLCARFQVVAQDGGPVVGKGAKEIASDVAMILYELIEPLGQRLVGVLPGTDGALYWDAGVISVPDSPQEVQ